MTSPTPFSVQVIDSGAPTIHDASGRMIAGVRYLGNMPDAVAEHNANARLFASAPRIKAALSRLLSADADDTAAHSEAFEALREAGE